MVAPAQHEHPASEGEPGGWDVGACPHGYPACPQPDAQPQRTLTSREEAMEKARGRIGGMRSNR